MDAARAGGRQADPDPVGGFRVAGGHEGGGLLVVDEHEADLVRVASQALHEAVDPVAGQPEDGVDAFFHEGFQDGDRAADLAGDGGGLFGGRGFCL